MGIQLSLLLAPPTSAPDPREDRSEPTVWVRRLWILRELRPGEEHVVRRLDLRRGLNILWAAPTDAGVDNRLFQGRLSGHTAGKTTFCRLIRHVLGEPTFATQAGRHRIRAKLPSAWVVGEVHVGGELWTAARPLWIGPHPFAVRGAPIDGVFSGSERLDYKAFIAALEAAAVTSLPVTRFAGEDAPIRWENVLPWLSRDQESRFASFIEWRDSTSESESPMLTADDRHLLVRTMLDLISDEERAEQGKNARLVAKKQAAAERAPLLAHQAEVDDKRLAELLGIGRSKANGPLFTGDPQALLAARRHALEATVAAARAGHDDGVEKQREAWEAAVAARAEAARDLREAEARLDAERAAMAEANDGAPPRVQLALLGTTLPPGRAFCSVPLAVARAERCPLAGASHAEVRSRRGRKIEDDAATPDEVLTALELQRTHLQGALDQARAAEHSAQQAFLGAQEAQRAEAATLEKERAALAQIERMLGHADATRREVEATEEELGRLEKELRRSYDRQEGFRKHHAAALGKVSDRFAYVVRALLGDTMGGRIEDDGRHLALRVDEHGDRESAAVATIKLLAFDLAALTASIEGHGAFPRFLIHDGPREADMDQTIYERLFLYAKSLEERFRGEAGFQYILTTTAPPPRSLQRAPWLIDPVLDASRADGRLLGVDL
jgi:hypothetical protein